MPQAPLMSWLFGYLHFSHLHTVVSTHSIINHISVPPTLPLFSQDCFVIKAVVLLFWLVFDTCYLLSLLVVLLSTVCNGRLVVISPDKPVVSKGVELHDWPKLHTLQKYNQSTKCNVNTASCRCQQLKSDVFCRHQTFSRDLDLWWTRPLSHAGKSQMTNLPVKWKNKFYQTFWELYFLCNKVLAKCI